MKFTAYIAEIFSEGTCASFSRWATAATVLTACWILAHLVLVNRALPDPLVIASLAAWMTAPYGINKVMAAFTPPASTTLNPTPQ